MRFVTKETEQEYTEFLENHERCNFQQSLEWGKVKTNWIKEVVLAEDENHKIIGSICVWIRKMPIFGNMMYSSRGPVCDIHDKKVLEQLTEGIKELGKKYNAFVLRIEPDIKKDDQEFRKIIEEIGITQSEMEHMLTLFNQKEKNRRDKENYSPSKRREKYKKSLENKGQMTKQEEIEICIKKMKDLLAQGLSSKEIMRILNLKKPTFYRYKKQIEN